jgi:hypothetical protein
MIRGWRLLLLLLVGVASVSLLGVSRADALTWSSAGATQKLALEQGAQEMTGNTATGFESAYQRSVIEAFRAQLNAYGATTGDVALAASEDTFLEALGATAPETAIPMLVDVPFSGPLIAAGLVYMAGTVGIGALASLMVGSPVPLASMPVFAVRLAGPIGASGEVLCMARNGPVPCEEAGGFSSPHVALPTTWLVAQVQDAEGAGWMSETRELSVGRCESWILGYGFSSPVSGNVYEDCLVEIEGELRHNNVVKIYHPTFQYQETGEGLWTQQPWLWSETPEYRGEAIAPPASYTNVHPSLTLAGEALAALDAPAGQFKNAIDKVLTETAESHIPDCTGKVSWECISAMEEAGYEDLTVTERSLETVDFANGSEGVNAQTPAPAEAPVTTPVEIDVNPEYVEIPQPTPTETVLGYEHELDELGFTKVETEVNTKEAYEAEDEARKKRRRVVVVIPSPGKITEPFDSPEPDTGPGDAPGSATDVKIETNPETEGSKEVETKTEVPPVEGGTGTRPHVSRLTVGGVTEPELHLPHIAVVCTKFPFGVPCWLVNELEAWAGTGSAPTLGFDSFTIHGYTIPGGKVNLAKLEPIMVAVRPFMILFGSIGIVLLFYKLATGTSVGGGSGSEQSSEQLEAESWEGQGL